MSESLPIFHETCLRLRHKLMYVDARHMTPGLVDDSSDTRLYWCQLTQDCRGPDGAGAAPNLCSASRACYEGWRLSARAASASPPTSGGSPS